MVLKSILPHRAPGIAKTSALQMRFDRPGGTCLQLECCYCAPVAQMDRAFASGAKGRWFESTRAYHSNHVGTGLSWRRTFQTASDRVLNRVLKYGSNTGCSWPTCAFPSIAKI